MIVQFTFNTVIHINRICSTNGQLFDGGMNFKFHFPHLFFIIIYKEYVKSAL